jgi:hypothetical protein
MSIISEYDLFHLVETGFCHQRNSVLGGSVLVTVPTKDTHESVVYVPFLICGLALPISPISSVSLISTI